MSLSRLIYCLRDETSSSSSPILSGEAPLLNGDPCLGGAESFKADEVMAALDLRDSLNGEDYGLDGDENLTLFPLAEWPLRGELSLTFLNGESKWLCLPHFSAEAALVLLMSS